MKSKLVMLHKPLSEIERCLKMLDRVRIREWLHEGPWLFPPYNIEGKEIKGFFGTGDVIFVCQRPSTAGGKYFTKPLDRGRIFYQLLAKYGLENAHLTDLVKCRGTGGEINEDLVNNCFLYLKREIRILKPKLRVAVGNYVYRELRRRLRRYDIVKIPHYASRNIKPEDLEKAIAEVAKRIKNI